ncbi:MAG: hypothetical protein JO244_04415, partial [Solirubrobacterales bacterium]|nr:hypothetical protein [Solirubrobacterales bacterium]
MTVSAVEGEPGPSVGNSELSQDKNPELSQDERAEPSQDEHSELSQDEHSELSQDERAELERLRAETAELHHQEHGQAGNGEARRRRHSWRTPVSIVLIVLGCILAPIAVIGSWAALEISDTGRYVATVEPLIHDPATQSYLTARITNEITSRLNVTGVVDQAASQLNSKGLTKISSLLTQFGPQISSSVNGFVQSTVHSVIASQAMANAWVQVNTVAHQSLVKVLSGQGGGAISTKNGQVVLDLGPLIVVAKDDLVAKGFKLASSIPTVHPTIALFQAKDLGQAQAYYRLAKGGRIV